MGCPLSAGYHGSVSSVSSLRRSRGARGREFSSLVKPIAHRATVMKGEGTIEAVARVLELQRQGRDIVRMEVGDPDFDTPAHITDAAVEALRGGATHYEASGGSLALRESVAEFFRKTTRFGC